MNVRLTWTDGNFGTYTVSIYRNATVVANASLTSPLVVLSNDEVTWTDTTAVAGSTYVYQMMTTKGTAKLYSAPFQITVASSSGPGPQTLLNGDLGLGYYGIVPAANMLTHAQIATALAFTGPSFNSAAMNWFKFARNGKTLFIPASWGANNISWTQLYNAGLVYGVQGPGPQNAGSGINQYRTFQNGSDTFVVRLPTGCDDRTNPTRVPSPLLSSDPTTARACSENADLLWSLMTVYPSVKRFVTAAGFTPQGLDLNAQWMTSICLLAQEKSPGTTGNLIDVGGKVTTTTSATWPAQLTLSVPATITAATTTIVWRPVLELVDTFELAVGL